MELTRWFKTFVFMIFLMMFLTVGLPQSAIALQAELTSAPHVPPPIARGPTTVQVEFEPVETEGPLHD